MLSGGVGVHSKKCFIHCFREEKIQTELLYPILLRSGLARETLGQLWGLANQQTPGQLIKEELFALLALVAVVQVALYCTVLIYCAIYVCKNATAVRQ